jgi:hypothetical protein
MNAREGSQLATILNELFNKEALKEDNETEIMQNIDIKLCKPFYFSMGWEYDFGMDLK